MVFLLLLAACRGETPAPPAQPPATPRETTTATPPKSLPTTTLVPHSGKEGYEAAIDWFRTTPRFRFVLDEGGVHAEGEMLREAVGAETVSFRSGDQEWRARSSPQGVMWERRSGSAWAAANAPSYGNRLYQRLTLAIDPQKKEGVPEVVEQGHFRFTDANSGKVHEIWSEGGQLRRMKIGTDFELKITP